MVSFSKADQIPSDPCQNPGCLGCHLAFDRNLSSLMSKTAKKNGAREGPHFLVPGYLVDSTAPNSGGGTRNRTRVRFQSQIVTPWP